MDSLKIGVMIDPPYVNENWTVDENPGMYIELVKVFCVSLNVKCNLTLAPSGSFGHYENNTWHGMVKNIAEKLYHLSLPCYTPTYQRYNVVDFSNVVYEEPVVLVTRSPMSSVESLFNFISFHWSVIACLTTIAAYIGMFLAYTEMTNWKPKRFLSTSFIRCMDSFSVIMSNDTSTETLLQSGRVLITFWLLSSLVLGKVFVNLF